MISTSFDGYEDQDQEDKEDDTLSAVESKRSSEPRAQKSAPRNQRERKQSQRREVDGGDHDTKDVQESDWKWEGDWDDSSKREKSSAPSLSSTSIVTSGWDSWNKDDFADSWIESSSIPTVDVSKNNNNSNNNRSGRLKSYENNNRISSGSSNNIEDNNKSTNDSSVNSRNTPKAVSTTRLTSFSGFDDREFEDSNQKEENSDSRPSLLHVSGDWVSWDDENEGESGNSSSKSEWHDPKWDSSWQD